jgi:arylsulfatase A-like enzyme
LIAGPRTVPRGKQVAGAVSLRDLPATIVDLLNFTGVSPFPGHSLARCWAANNADTVSDEEFLLTETSDELSRTAASETHARALLKAGKVYIRNKDGSEEFYDQITDPAEVHNLSKSNEAAGLLAHFRDEMKAIDQKAIAIESSRSGAHFKQRSIGTGKHRERGLPVASTAHTPAECGIEELD